MSSLVERLSSGIHEIVVRPVADDPVAELQRRLNKGYVHVRFTNTQGGTELGVLINPTTVDASKADFEKKTGTVEFAGLLKLDYVPVRCVVQVDLATLEGQGHLDVLPAEEWESERATLPKL